MTAKPRYAVFRGGSMMLGRRSLRYVYEVCDTHRAQTDGMTVVFRGTAQECRRECERRNAEWSKQQRQVQP